MKAPSLKGRKPLVLGGVAVVGVVGAVGVYFRPLIPYLLVALLVVGVIWIAAHFAMQLWRRRRQRSFDAGVAAEEGIDDRRREWASWTEELNRQGIDRYELPFYLLVGEPQSGKSVLLQNSELHFPFGQTRLSGVGGTRGCDWWFTEEAVILDLAGRLFTHEGGASDALEWGAFLELLSGFRPLCPANGVMLVIPCDSLLLDNREEATRKASRMQEAMLTLTGKLQAQLPIYVILTKGDRVFGFAETVHRLDSEKRQQMFGWSRRAEDFEQPFDMVEVREAFGDMVARARLLQETMLATLRLPEGLPEADRVYAFPDELEALMPNLEVYLKRIFSESTLVDRLYFRGFYLTSGLQLGAPIAKVCSKLLGSEGEADKRNLEALFSKQQAYFIKDLVRRRVFSERGLVRPTKKRVARAHRSAWIGYGSAAVIALVSVVWSATYVISDYKAQEKNAFRVAIDLGREVADTQNPEPDTVMGAIEAAWQAQEVELHSLEELGENRRESFEQLIQRLGDERLVPSLRRRAERGLWQVLDSEATRPSDARAFLQRVSQAQVLLGDWQPLESAQLAGRTQVQRSQAQDLVAVIDDPALVERAAQLLEKRKSIAADVQVPASLPRRSDAGLEGALGEAVAWLDGQWDRLLLFGDPLQVEGQVGCLIAWHDAMEAKRQLAELTEPSLVATQDGEFHAATERLRRATDYLRGSNVERNALVALTEGGFALDIALVRVELDALAATRSSFAAKSGRATLVGQTEWPSHDKLVRFLDTQLARLAADGASTAPGALEGRLLVSQALVAHQVVFDVCGDEFLAADDAAPKGLPAALEAARTRVDTEQRSGSSNADFALAQGVFRAKVRMLYDTYAKTYPTGISLATELAGAGQAGQDRASQLRALAHLVELSRRLRDIVAGDIVSRWRADVTKLAAETLDGISADAVAVREGEVEIDVELLTALDACHAQFMDADLGARIGRISEKHARGVSSNVLAQLQRLEKSGTKTERLLLQSAAFLKSVERPASANPNGQLLSPSELEKWSRDCLEIVRAHLDHHVQYVQSKCTPPTTRGASALAADIKDRIKPDVLVQWQDTCDLPDLEQQNLVDARQALTARAKDVAGELDAFWGKWGRVAAPDKGKRWQPLALLTEALSVNQAKPSVNGKLVAAAFKDTQKERAAAQAVAAGSAAEYYLERLTTALEEECRITLRDLYVKELGALLNGRATFKRAMYMDRSELLELDGRTQRQLAEDLAALFDPKGDFDRLQDDYQQTLDPIVEFRPGSDARPEIDSDWWGFDEFLRDLRRFIQGDDFQKKVGECTVKIWLLPTDDGRKGAWARPALFTNFESEKPDNYVNTRDAQRVGPLEWRFDEKTEKSLWMRWSKATSGKQSDDIEVQVKSCFGPLLWSWQSGRPEDDGRSWEITIDPVPPATESASFVLEFERPLPARPVRPW